MREDIIHFIWQHQYFAISKAFTTDGEPIQVIRQGFYNTNAGPDFEQAKIKIGEVEWNGDVEIHSKSTDWAAHKHDHDEAYNKVVLHVVWENNGLVKRKDGTTLPTLVLKQLVDPKLLQRANTLLENINPIPCSTQINEVSELVIIESIHRALIKRLERKAMSVLNELNESNGDWSEAAYRLFMCQMGMKVNSEPFYELSKAVPYKLIRKYKNETRKLEALLFGASGLLSTSKKDAYINELEKEYEFLKHKHNLSRQLAPEQWKFMRLRPANFPTIRVAQVAEILSNTIDVFEMLTESTPNDLRNYMKVATSEYWRTHYRFGVEAKKKVPAIGKTSIDLIMLNVVAPLLVAYSKHISDDIYLEKAVAAMESIKPEENRIIKQWNQLGIKPQNGAESQGLIELYNEHCQQKACLSCGIGYKLLNYKE